MLTGLSPKPRQKFGILARKQAVSFICQQDKGHTYSAIISAFHSHASAACRRRGLPYPPLISRDTDTLRG